jgi:hypothetical protein
MFGVLLALVFVLGIVSVQGASVSVSDFNSTMKIVSISNAEIRQYQNRSFWFW